jgi:hypothetical protein
LPEEVSGNRVVGIAGLPARIGRIQDAVEHDDSQCFPVPDPVVKVQDAGPVQQHSQQMF